MNKIDFINGTSLVKKGIHKKPPKSKTPLGGFEFGQFQKEIYLISVIFFASTKLPALIV